MTETRRVSDLVETVRTELIAAKIERRVSQLRVLATASALAFWAPNGTCWVPKRYLPPLDQRSADAQRRG
jgi:hypothetical protein